MSGGPWRVAVTVPGEAVAEAVAASLAEQAEAISAFEAAPEGDWLVQAFATARPDAAAIDLALTLVAAGFGLDPLAATIEKLPDTDWLRRNQESFPPLHIARFFVYGTHLDMAPPVAAVPLRIDAATAFGTGEHPTTAGCLMALDRLARRQGCRRVLDLGTGTGILAIAAARLWHRPVLAIDIDPHSVRVAAENVGLNRVAHLVACRVGASYRQRAIRRRGPFDLVFANILARPLIALAPGLAQSLVPGGHAILSGLLAAQEPMVAAAHRVQGLCLIERIAIGGWHTLLFQKP